MAKIQTLVFRTKEKSTTLYEDFVEKSTIPGFSFDNVTTVAIRESSFYEIMVRKGADTRPVARLPIACTNMIILEE